ncbi:hypothetical protein ES703_00200 [subsurface metagenome]
MSAGFISSALAVSSIRFNSVSMSPIPSRRATKRSGTKGSRSSMCSPVPMNLIGAPVAVTAERAPPPFAVPSSLVIKIEPMSVVALNAAACSFACCPIVPSTTSMISSGPIVLAIWRISFIRASSLRCLPAESMMINSRRSFLNRLTPSFASLTESLALGSPKSPMPTCWPS